MEDLDMIGLLRNDKYHKKCKNAVKFLANENDKEIEAFYDNENCIINDILNILYNVEYETHYNKYSSINELGIRIQDMWIYLMKMLDIADITKDYSEIQHLTPILIDVLMCKKLNPVMSADIIEDIYYIIFYLRLCHEPEEERRSIVNNVLNLVSDRNPFLCLDFKNKYNMYFTWSTFKASLSETPEKLRNLGSYGDRVFPIDTYREFLDNGNLPKYFNIMYESNMTIMAIHDGEEKIVFSWLIKLVIRENKRFESKNKGNKN